jgi:hypothetical protein
MRSDNHLVRDVTFAQMQNLPDPANFTLQKTNRDELRRLHEGWKMRVVAVALVARRGNVESCNLRSNSTERILTIILFW